jgi:hypothetical protein
MFSNIFTVEKIGSVINFYEIQQKIAGADEKEIKKIVNDLVLSPIVEQINKDIEKVFNDTLVTISREILSKSNVQVGKPSNDGQPVKSLKTETSTEEPRWAGKPAKEYAESNGVTLDMFESCGKVTKPMVVKKLSEIKSSVAKNNTVAKKFSCKISCNGWTDQGKKCKRNGFINRGKNMYCEGHAEHWAKFECELSSDSDDEVSVASDEEVEKVEEVEVEKVEEVEVEVEEVEKVEVEKVEEVEVEVEKVEVEVEKVEEVEVEVEVEEVEVEVEEVEKVEVEVDSDDEADSSDTVSYSGSDSDESLLLEEIDY